MSKRIYQYLAVSICAAAIMSFLFISPVTQCACKAHDDHVGVEEDDPDGPVLRKDLDAVYELIALNNRTQFTIMDMQERIMHYIAGRSEEHTSELQSH